MNEHYPRRAPVFDDPPDASRPPGEDPTRRAILDAFSGCAPFESLTIAVCRDAEPSIADPDLRAAVGDFIGQEQEHARAHGQECARLGLAGSGIQRLVARNRALLFTRLLPRLGPPMRLAWLAGFEHITLMIAEVVLFSPFLEGTPPETAALYRWHAAEEIEHRALAMRLLRARGVGYLRRQVGFLLAAVVALGALVIGTCSLLHERGELGRPTAIASLVGVWFGPGGFAWRLLRFWGAYLMPGYDPQNYRFAREGLSALAAFERAAVPEPA